MPLNSPSEYEDDSSKMEYLADLKDKLQHEFDPSAPDWLNLEPEEIQRRTKIWQEQILPAIQIVDPHESILALEIIAARENIKI